MLRQQTPPPESFEWNDSTVRALRSHLGVSQKRMAHDLGVRQQTVSEWETGMYKPRGSSLTILTLVAVSSGFDWSGS